MIPASEALRLPRVALPTAEPPYGAAPPAAAAPTPLGDLDPAQVLLALINTPAFTGEAPWPPMNGREAQAILGPKQRAHLPTYRGHPLHLYIDRYHVCGAYYDSYGFNIGSAAIVAHLRKPDAPLPPSGRPAAMRADAAPFVPRCPPPQRTPSFWAPPPAPPPAVPPQPQGAADVVLPPRPVLEQRLRGIEGPPWFHHSLVPQLLTAAGKQMTPTTFLNFYYLSLSMATDEEDRGDAQPLLHPCNNPLIPALVPDERARWQLLGHMAKAEEACLSRAPSPPIAAVPGSA